MVHQFQQENHSRNLNNADSFQQPPDHSGPEVVNPMVSSITRSIYGHINHLITQNEASPDKLEQLFRDLQLISREDTLQRTRNEGVNLASFSNNTSTTTSAIGLASALRQLEDNVRVSNRSNFNSTNNNNQRHWMDRGPAGRAPDDHVLSADDEDEAMFKLTINQRLGISESRSSSQDVKAEEEVARDTDFPAAGGVSPRKRRVNNHSHDEIGVVESDALGDVAVPKNNQRNLTSRGESRCKVQPMPFAPPAAGVRKEKPRNLNCQRVSSTTIEPIRPNTDTDSKDAAAPDSFNQKSPAEAANTSNGAQSEMAEADQACTPEKRDTYVEGGAASLDYIHSELAEDESFSFVPEANSGGLDRVPTRLSTNELDQRPEDSTEEKDENPDDFSNFKGPSSPH